MNIQGIDGLFPLAKIDFRLQGYYINRVGSVFSTKQYQKPSRLTGQGVRGGVSNGGYRNYTLTLISGGSRGVAKTFSDTDLLRRAAAHPDWAKETTTSAVGTTASQQSITKDPSILTKMPASLGKAPAPMATPAVPPQAGLPFQPALQEAVASNHATTLVQGIYLRGFIIGRVENGVILFGSKPPIHLTEDSVKAEVARLAAKSPGTQIIWVKIQGAATVNGINWA